LLAQRMMVALIGPSDADEQKEAGKQSRKEPHKSSKVHIEAPGSGV
jgi:hypothetical protein